MRSSGCGAVSQGGGRIVVAKGEGNFVFFAGSAWWAVLKVEFIFCRNVMVGLQFVVRKLEHVVERVGMQQQERM